MTYRERFADAKHAWRALDRMRDEYGGFCAGCGASWVEIPYPRLAAVETLVRLLEHEDCTWTYALGKSHHDDPIWTPHKIGFDEPKLAVMFKLMLP